MRYVRPSSSSEVPSPFAFSYAGFIKFGHHVGAFSPKPRAHDYIVWVLFNKYVINSHDDFRTLRGVHDEAADFAFSSER